jgi:hypothetical protein
MTDKTASNGSLGRVDSGMAREHERRQPGAGSAADKTADHLPVWAGGRQPPGPDFVLTLLLSVLICAAMVAAAILWLTGQSSPLRQDVIAAEKTLAGIDSTGQRGLASASTSTLSDFPTPGAAAAPPKATPSAPWATLDLAELMRLKEQRVTQALLRGGATAAAREAALAEAGAFSVQLAAVLRELPQRCGCTVLQRSAILAAGPGVPELPDLTLKVRQELGL